MNLTEEEKEELFTEFAIKFAEMDKEDKRLTVAKNNHALAGMSKEYYKVWRSGSPKLSYRYLGVYSAYLKLRAAVPFMICAKKYAKALEIEGADPRPFRYSAETYGLENEDIEEATKAGKILLDAMYKYLIEE